MYYFLIINLFSFTLMGLDKHKAIKQRYRISELSFFMLAVLGGSVGILLAMMIFHHKTKNLYLFIYDKEDIIKNPEAYQMAFYRSYDKFGKNVKGFIIKP